MKQYKCILKPPCLLKEVIRKIHRVWLHLVKIPECKRICNDRMHRSMSTCTWAGDGRRDSKGWGMRKFWGMMEMFYIFLSSFWTYIFIPFLHVHSSRYFPKVCSENHLHQNYWGTFGKCRFGGSSPILPCQNPSGWDLEINLFYKFPRWFL